jgi:hypothetical protein
MSYKGSENSSVDATQQAQITTNAQAIAALQTEVTADEVLIEANTTAIQGNRDYADAINARLDLIGTNLQIPVTAFPASVDLSNAGDWFAIGGNLQVNESGLYLVQLIVVSAIHSSNDLPVGPVSNGLSVWDNATAGLGANLCTVMGGTSIISSFRQNDEAGIGNNISCLVRLTKNQVISFSMWQNTGFGTTITFKTDWTSGGTNDWPRDAINVNLSGVLVTLLSLT